MEWGIKIGMAATMTRFTFCTAHHLSLACQHLGQGWVFPIMKAKAWWLLPEKFNGQI